MSADPALIATQTVESLTPFLPLLIKADSHAAEEAGSRLGSDAWESARRIWSRLQPAIDADPRASAAVLELAAAPNDSDLRAQLRIQLRRLVANDEELAVDLNQLIAAAPSPSNRDTGISISGPISADSFNIGIVLDDLHDGKGLDALPSAPVRTADSPPPVE
jgi:hypothetical protein